MIFGVLRGRRTGVADTNADGGVGCRSASSAGGETAGVEGGAASLSRALLSLSSLAAQQRALHYILQALQIQLCRDAVVAAFSNVSIELLLFFFFSKTRSDLRGPSSFPQDVGDRPEVEEPQASASLTASASASSSAAAASGATPTLSDLQALVKPKEIAALWELLKLSAARHDAADRTRATLTDVLTGVFSLFVCFFNYFDVDILVIRKSFSLFSSRDLFRVAKLCQQHVVKFLNKFFSSFLVLHLLRPCLAFH